MRYFITFACYCARLHGDESGSVDRHHNLVGSRLLEPGAERVQAERRQMLQDPDVLDPVARPVVLAARSNPAPVIVEAETRPERILNEFKAYASGEPNQLPSERPDRKRWARHGSTRWLWNDEDVRHALQ